MGQALRMEAIDAHGDMRSVSCTEQLISIYLVIFLHRIERQHDLTQELVARTGKLLGMLWASIIPAYTMARGLSRMV